VDPALRLNRNYLKKFEQVKTISFNLKTVLGFKKEYKMIARESSVAKLIKKCADQFAERDQNIGQALQTLNQLKNGRVEGQISE
jgi:hypothetical protein